MGDVVTRMRMIIVKRSSDVASQCFVSRLVALDSNGLNNFDF